MPCCTTSRNYAQLIFSAHTVWRWCECKPFIMWTWSIMCGSRFNAGLVASRKGARPLLFRHKMMWMWAIYNVNMIHLCMDPTHAHTRILPVLFRCRTYSPGQESVLFGYAEITTIFYFPLMMVYMQKYVMSGEEMIAKISAKLFTEIITVICYCASSYTFEERTSNNVGN